MKSEDTSLFDDPTTPGYLRDLLQAGRRGSAEYDVDRGLAKHLAAISAAPTAPWAPTTVTKLTTATTVAKVWPSWIGFAAMPLAAASVAGLLWVYSADRPAPVVTGVAGSAVNPPAQALEQAPSVNAAPTAVGPTAVGPTAVGPTAARDERYEDEARPERRRSGARPNAVRGNGSRVASRATGEGDLEGLAIGSTEAPAIDTRSGDGAGVRKGSAAVEPSVATTKAQTSEASSQRNAVAREREREQEQQAQTEAAAEPARSGTEAAAKPAPVVDESRLEREMQMLAVTQRVLASDPARALRLSEQGEREFRGSMFSAERRQLGLLALVKLGRLDEARRAGKPFLARYPKAPWSERLRRALATGVVE